MSFDTLKKFNIIIFKKLYLFIFKVCIPHHIKIWNQYEFQFHVKTYRLQIYLTNIFYISKYDYIIIYNETII